MAGYLPHYRGVHCSLFTIYHGDFDKIKSTIHFVDHGVDTGDIIEVVAPPFQAGDNDENALLQSGKDGNPSPGLARRLLAGWQAFPQSSPR